MKVSNYCQDWHPNGKGPRTVVTIKDGVMSVAHPPPVPSPRPAMPAPCRDSFGGIFSLRPRKPTMTLAEWDARRASFNP